MVFYLYGDAILAKTSFLPTHFPTTLSSGKARSVRTREPDPRTFPSFFSRREAASKQESKQANKEEEEEERRKRNQKYTKRRPRVVSPRIYVLDNFTNILLTCYYRRLCLFFSFLFFFIFFFFFSKKREPPIEQTKTQPTSFTTRKRKQQQTLNSRARQTHTLTFIPASSPSLLFIFLLLFQLTKAATTVRRPFLP